MNSNDEVMVSIVCVTYNHQDYIKQAIEGFVMQKTNFKYEVIIHDDASKDDTAQIVREYQKNFPNIIHPILQECNQYSKGKKIHHIIAPNVRGKYIAICEGDNFWIDDRKLQKQVDFLENHPEYSGCVHNSILQNLLEKKLTLFNDGLKGICDHDVDIYDVLDNWGKEFHTSSIMLRASIYRDYFINEKPLFSQNLFSVGDFPLAIYMCFHGKIRYFCNVMSVYRFNTPGSWSERYRNDPKKTKIDESIINMLKEADEYSSHKYHEAFDKNISYREFLLLESTHNYKKMTDKKYSQYVENRGMRYKRMLWIKRCCPLLPEIARFLKRILSD